jgi:hypothetical protein
MFQDLETLMKRQRQRSCDYTAVWTADDAAVVAVAAPVLDAVVAVAAPVLDPQNFDRMTVDQLHAVFDRMTDDELDAVIARASSGDVSDDAPSGALSDDARDALFDRMGDDELDAVFARMP